MIASQVASLVVAHLIENDQSHSKLVNLASMGTAIHFVGIQTISNALWTVLVEQSCA